MDPAALDRLYAAPLSRFVPTRNALAAEARRAGDRDLAARVRKLARPAVPAWALNQLVRRDRKRFARWMAAVAGLQSAQAGVLAGRVEVGAVRDAQRAEREAMVELREAAAEVLAADGQNAGVAMLERVVRTFRGAAADPAARDALAAGRLHAEHDEPGFEALLAGTATPVARAKPPAPAAPTRAREPADLGRRRAAAQRAAAERTARLRALRDALRAAREERAAAGVEAARTAKAAERARRAADEAAARAKDAAAEAAAAAKALEHAAGKVAAVEREVDALEEG